MECDVIVIGAGISGLATADRLSARGQQVTVLEASGRVGGRLLSRGGLDFGAAWYWPGEHRVAALVDELGIDTHPQFMDGDALYDAPDGVVRLDGNPIDVPSHRFTGGADELARVLARRVQQRAGSDVRLDSHVQRVGTTDAGERPMTVSVRGTRAEDLRSAHVVLALPPALATSTIAFDPPLPRPIEDLAARTPVWMGAITKVVVRYPAAFWRAVGLAGSAVSHRGPMRELHDLSGPDGRPAALFGFAPTTEADGPVDEAAALAQLVRLFGPDAADPLSIDLLDWRRAPAIAPPGVEHLVDYSTFGDPAFGNPACGGRLHWTSTETADVAPGHIEGALTAAERTVAAIEAATNMPTHPTIMSSEEP